MLNTFLTIQRNGLLRSAAVKLRDGSSVGGVVRVWESFLRRVKDLYDPVLKIKESYVPPNATYFPPPTLKPYSQSVL